MRHTKTISSRRLLLDTSEAFGIDNSNWFANGLDWIAKAIQAIGYHWGFDTKEIPLRVSNNRVLIPAGVESINYISYNGCQLPLGIDGSEHAYMRDNYRPMNVASDSEILMLTKQMKRLEELQEEDKNQDILDAIIETKKKISDILQNFRLGTRANNVDFEYFNIENNYIKTSFSSGIIVLNAECFKVDERGYPLIIGTFNYTESVSHFLMMRLITSGYKHPVFNYRDIKSEWEDYTLKASNEGKLSSIQELDRFVERWTSVKRDLSITTI